MVSCGLSVHFHGGAFAQVSLIEKKTQQFADYVRQELLVIIINVSLGSLGCGLLWPFSSFSWWYFCVSFFNRKKHTTVCRLCQTRIMA